MRTHPHTRTYTHSHTLSHTHTFTCTTHSHTHNSHTHTNSLYRPRSPLWLFHTWQHYTIWGYHHPQSAYQHPPGTRTGRGGERAEGGQLSQEWYMESVCATDCLISVLSLSFSPPLPSPLPTSLPPSLPLSLPPYTSLPLSSFPPSLPPSLLLPSLPPSLPPLHHLFSLDVNHQPPTPPRWCKCSQVTTALEQSDLPQPPRETEENFSIHGWYECGREGRGGDRVRCHFNWYCNREANCLNRLLSTTFSSSPSPYSSLFLLLSLSQVGHNDEVVISLKINRMYITISVTVWWISNRNLGVPYCGDYFGVTRRTGCTFQSIPGLNRQLCWGSAQVYLLNQLL